MPYKDLRDFITALEKAGELLRVNEPVSPDLEITELADRSMKSNGPALLFEKPVGHNIPVLVNAFGSAKRMAMALGVNNIEEIATRVGSLLHLRPPSGIISKLKMLPDLIELSATSPKKINSAPCQEIVLDGNEASLDFLPILKCWPLDGGPFITLPIVITKDPNTGARNLGMYRLQVFDSKTTGMHWHTHKIGAKHYAEYEKLGKRMPVAVAIGGDPVVIYSATAPLPEGIDELAFAGWIRGKPVDIVPCKTIDLYVPAYSEIILEGYVEPGERRTEGPFGDHTGYYSMPDEYPVFHITCITHRKNPIYPATVVGKPPMEDCWIAKATERIFLPLLKMQLPEIVDINLPVEGVFHNLAIVSIRKQFPGHARKVMHALWGLGQLAFTKIIIVVEDHVNVQDIGEVLWRVGNNIDPRRDIELVDGPVDVLNHASPFQNYGSKMGIDATRPWPQEGFNRIWPPDIEMPSEIVARMNSLAEKIGLPIKEAIK